jgi:radical SAM protein with 4Fe4S-binding SPASM domain
VTRLRLPTNHLAGPFSGDKILAHADTLSALRRGETPPPITVEFDATNVCNLDCPYCTNASYRKRRAQQLPLEVAARTITDLGVMGCKAITFTGGGEPLTHPGIEQLIGLAAESDFDADRVGMDVALITNGVKLDCVDLGNLVQRCTWIRVSLDAWDAESYAASKGRDCFEHVLTNVQMLTDAKREAGADCTVGVGILTEERMAPNVGLIAATVRELGADYVQFRPMTFVPGDLRAADHPQGTTEMWVKAFAEARAAETTDFRVYASTPKYDHLTDEDRGYTYCSGVLVSCVIGATGDVWACCHMRGNPRFSLGNVNERRFPDIWNDADTRNAVYARIGNFEECMPLCRFDAQNRLLARFNFQPQHENFL